MKITVDRDACIGAANCIAVAPKVFQLDNESKAIVIDPKGADDQTILEAAKSCPTKAIIIEDDKGQHLYP